MHINHAWSRSATCLLLTVAVGIAAAESMFDGFKQEVAKAAGQVGEAASTTVN